MIALIAPFSMVQYRPIFPDHPAKLWPSKRRVGVSEGGNAKVSGSGHDQPRPAAGWEPAAGPGDRAGVPGPRLNGLPASARSERGRWVGR